MGPYVATTWTENSPGYAWSGEAVLYPRLLAPGVCAGQGHQSGRALEHMDHRWYDRGLTHGINPVIYDHGGLLHLSTIAQGSQGYRYVADDGHLVTGDETVNSQTPLAQSYGLSGFWEWTHLGGITIGQGEGGCIVQIGNGPHRVLDPGECYRVHFTRHGSLFAVAFILQRENKARYYWGTVAELEGLPLETPVVTPERPLCRIVSYPATVTLGQLAICEASYTGGTATSASWLWTYGDAIWVTDTIQTPPRPQHGYAFPHPGIVGIRLRVDGPGGSDQTVNPRFITVEDRVPPTDPTARKQICFGPNLGSSDMAQLFTESNLWQWGFDRIGAFQFYQGHFSLDGRDYGNRFCGANTWDWLNGANAFTKLQAAGVLIEVQVVGKSLDAIEKIVAKFAALDPPVTLGAVCYDHAFMELSGQDFAAEVRTIRERWPSMVIGAYCAYPMASVGAIYERLEVWDAFGGRPDFLRMDVDYNQRSVYTADIHRQIRELVADRSDPQMTLQVTINAKEHISDAEWVKQAGAWFTYCQGLGFDGYAVQSWASTPSEENRQLPHNLPESDPTSHTALVRSCLEKL